MTVVDSHLEGLLVLLNTPHDGLRLHSKQCVPLRYCEMSDRIGGVLEWFGRAKQVGTFPHHYGDR